MKNTIALTFVIVSAVLLRLVPHVPNFAPVGALCLFGGSYLNKKYSVGLMLLIMLISDYLLLYIHPFSSSLFTFSHLYSPLALIHSTTFYVYGSFLITVGMGIWVKKHISWENIALGSLSSSMIFFLITNFGVWATGMYSRNLFGLWESYIMGLPFLRPTVFGDLFYNGIFFSTYYIITQQICRYAQLGSGSQK